MRLLKKRKKQKATGGGVKLLSFSIFAFVLFTVIQNIYMMIEMPVNRDILFRYFLSNIPLLIVGILSLSGIRGLNAGLFILSIYSIIQFDSGAPVSELLAGFSIVALTRDLNKRILFSVLLFIAYIICTVTIAQFTKESPSICLSRFLVVLLVAYISYINIEKNPDIRKEFKTEPDKLTALIINGCPEKEIASELNISKSTVTRRIKALRESNGCLTTSDLRALLIKSNNK